MSRQHVSSGAPYEKLVGYCRAVRVGNRIEVSGTAPLTDEGKTIRGDVYQQARRCIDIVDRAVRELGGSLSDIVRTRIYMTDAGDWHAIGQAHAEAFEPVRPATSFIVVKALIDPSWKVEIEATAIVEGPEAT